MAQPTNSLLELLKTKRQVILNKWFQQMIEAYPAETARQLGKSNSQFANPVASSFRQGLAGIYDYLLQDKDFSAVGQDLDKILRIKAVQDVLPSRALAFLYFFKRLAREETAQLQDSCNYVGDLGVLESKLDELVLLAFDYYTQCRERISEIRIGEIKKRCEILERVNRVNESLGAKGNLGDHDNQG